MSTFDNTNFNFKQFISDIEAEEKSILGADPALLAENKNEKLQRLSQKASGAGVQQYLSDIVDQQVYKRDDGSMYQQRRNETTGLLEDVDYVGDVRNMYIDDTLEGNMKLGLADPRSGGFENRYSKDAINLATGEHYDGTPGARGVTPADKALMEILLPYNVATVGEADIHRNFGNIANRPDISKEELGAGYTEYTTPDAPLWNMDVQAGEAPSADVYVPKEGRVRGLSSQKDPDAFLNYIKQHPVEGMLGESIDIAQSSLIQQYGKSNKALRNISRSVASALGMDQETIDKYLPKADQTGTIGFGDMSSDELAKQQVADKITGVMAKTREEQKAGMDKALEDVKNGDYVSAVIENIKILPYMLGDSAGEMASLFAGYPGVAIAVAARVNEDAEEYEKNNGEAPDAQWMLGSTLSNSAALLGERFLIKSGVGGLIQKGVSKVGRVGGVLESAVGEAVQEYFDQTQQMYMTQKEGEKTLGEIATSPEAKLAAIAGGAMGGPLRAAGEVGSATVDAVASKIEDLKGVSVEDMQKRNKDLQKEGGVVSAESLAKVVDAESAKKTAEAYAEAMDDVTQGKMTQGIALDAVVRMKEKNAVTPEEKAAVEELKKALNEMDDAPYSLVDSVKSDIEEATKEVEDVLKADKKARIAVEADGGTYEPNEESKSAVIRARERLAGLSENIKGYTESGVKGSEEFSGFSEEIQNKLNAMDDYIAGKDIDAVSEEFLSKGMKRFDIAGNEEETKRGLNTWYDELKVELEGSLKEELTGDGGVSKAATAKKASFDEFGRFMTTRNTKLHPKENASKDVENAGTLLAEMQRENNEAIKVLNKLIEDVDASTVSDAKKAKYVEKLRDSIDAVNAANAEIDRRKGLIERGKKIAVLQGLIRENQDLQYAKRPDGSEFLGTFVKKKQPLNPIMDIKDDKVVPLKTAETTEETSEEVLPTVEEVATKIATGEEITTADEQVQANEGAAVEAELQRKVKETEPKAKEVVPNEYPEGMSELEAEINDLKSMGKLAGISFDIDFNSIPELLELQRKLIEAAVKEDVTGFVSYKKDPSHVESQDRIDRAHKSARKNAEGKELQHYLAQAAEEVVEVLDELGVEKSTSELLEVQKRVFKAVRFSPNRVNKSTGKTNLEQLKEAIEKSTESIEVKDSSTVEDLLKVAAELNSTVKNNVIPKSTVEKKAPSIYGEAANEYAMAKEGEGESEYKLAKETDQGPVGEIVTEATVDTLDEKVEGGVDEVLKEVQEYVDAIENYETELDNLYSEKRNLQNRIKAHKDEVGRFKEKLKRTWEYEKKARAVEGTKNIAEGLVKYAKSILRGLMKSIAAFNESIRKHKDLIKGYREDLLVLNKKIKEVKDELKPLRESRREGLLQEIEDIVAKVDPRGLTANEMKELTAKAVLEKRFGEDKTSMGNKILEDVYKATGGHLYPFTNKGRLFKKTEDSVFGKVESFANAKVSEIVEQLPESFKEFFATNAATKLELKNNIETMQDWISVIEGVNDLNFAHVNTKVNNKGIVESNTIESGAEFINALMLITGKEKTGGISKMVVPEQMDEMLKFYVAKMMVDAQALAGNMAMMEDKDLSEVVGGADVHTARQMAERGYAPVSSLRPDIGTAVYNMMGVKLNDVPELTRESLVSGLGVLVQKMAIEQGLMDTVKVEGETTIIYVKPSRSKLAELEINRNELTKAVNKLQYMNIANSRQLPMLGEVEAKESRVLMNSTSEVSADENAFMNEQETHVFKLSPRLDKWMELDSEVAMRAFGWIDVDSVATNMDLKAQLRAMEGDESFTDTDRTNLEKEIDFNMPDMHISKIIKQRAINMKIEREYDLLKMFHMSLKGKEFRLPWGMTVSKRYTLTTDLNYQESKMHREFIREINDEKPVDVKEERAVIGAAVMQGLDMDPDKKSNETVQKDFDAILDEPWVRSAVDDFKAWIADGTVPNEKTFEKIFNGGEGYHAYSAIEAMAMMELEENPVLGLKIEADAITSGMVLTLQQLGTKDAMRLAEKGGIYTKESKTKWEGYVKKWLGKDTVFTAGALIEAGKAHAKAIESGEVEGDLASDEVFKDIYETVGIGMVNTVQEYKEKLETAGENRTAEESRQLVLINEIGELNLKNVRKIAKSPVMVYVYGASMNSIKRKLAYSLGVDTLVKMIEKGENLDFVDQYTKDAAYIDEYGKPKDVEGMSQKERLMYLDVDSIADEVQIDTDASFGEAITEAFNGTFGEVDKLRKLIKGVELMTFEAYKVYFEKKVMEQVKLIHGDNVAPGSYMLNKEQLDAIQKDMQEAGLGHDATWYNEDGSVKSVQPLTKKEAKSTVLRTGIGSIDEKGKPVVDSEGKKLPATVGGINIKVEISNTGAAPTITIHGVDGELMNKTLGGSTYTGENVYDAFILRMSGDLLQNTGNTYNENVAKIGFERSILVDNIAKLENMLADMPDALKVQMVNNMTKNKSQHLENEQTRLDIAFSDVQGLLDWYAKSVVPERTALGGQELFMNHTHVAPLVGKEVVAGQAKELGDRSTIDRLMKALVKHEQDIIAIDNAKKDIANYIKSKPALVALMKRNGIDLKGC